MFNLIFSETSATMAMCTSAACPYREAHSATAWKAPSLGESMGNLFNVAKLEYDGNMMGILWAYYGHNMGISGKLTLPWTITIV